MEPLVGQPGQQNRDSGDAGAATLEGYRGDGTVSPGFMTRTPTMTGPSPRRSACVCIVGVDLSYDTVIQIAVQALRVTCD